MHESEIPGHHPAPVVLDAFRLVAQVIAALVDGYALITVGKSSHLIAPAVPEIREAVDHYYERAAADARVVDLDAIRVGVAIFDFTVDGRGLQRYSQCYGQQCSAHERKYSRSGA